MAISTVPKTMAAVQLTGHGGMEKLVYRTDVPVPKPVPGEVIHGQKSKNPTTELAISGPEYKKVFRVEETYIRKGLSKWKNFDAKGRRIEMDGTLIPMLDEKKYAKNFGKHGLPAVLAKLVLFQNDVGGEFYSEGFCLQVDDKGLFKGFA